MKNKFNTSKKTNNTEISSYKNVWHTFDNFFLLGLRFGFSFHYSKTVLNIKGTARIKTDFLIEQGVKKTQYKRKFRS